MSSHKLCVLIAILLNFFAGNISSMENINNKTKYLKDYKKPSYSASSIFLTIDLYDNEALVTNKMKVSRNENSESGDDLFLDGSELELVDIFIDNNKLAKDSYKIVDKGITIHTVPKQFEITVINKIYPQKNTSLEGLYLAGEEFLTQCEPNGFSKIAYGFDRPDVMAVFTTKLIANTKYKNLLSNGDLIEQGKIGNDRHYAVWHDKSNKPTYLFAAVFGNLEVIKDKFKTKSGKEVSLEIFSTKENVDKLDYAMYSLKSSMKWDEEKFGREYDLNTYMIVATPHFNSGAMENKGLNIFNTKYVLADPNTSTDDDYKNVYSVIGHEYFHNWTGNRITLRDWFQLSLKEGLTVFRDQEFSADEFSRPIQRIDDANVLRTVQFAEDAGPLSHPVKPETYVKMDNFYTTTVYEKGAEVIRMIKTIIGDKLFAEGMELYFNRNDGKAVTTEDFVKSFEDVSKIDLSQFKLWYSQAGTPKLTVTDNYDAQSQKYTLIVAQSCPETRGQKKSPFHIPIKIGLIGKKSGKNITFNYEGSENKEVIAQLMERRQEFIFENVAEQPVPSLLRDFSAPVKLDYSYSDEDMLLLYENDTNEFNRWDFGQKFLQKYIIKFTNDLIANKKLTMPPKLEEAMRKLLLDKNLDKEFIARSLLLPNQKIIQQEMAEIYPEEIFKARKFLITQIATTLKKEILQTYQELDKELGKTKYSISNKDLGSRLLRNICLQYLAYADKSLGEELSLKQLKKSDNLTDRMAALRVLIDSDDNQIYEQASKDFYEKWKQEELVVYNWLSLIPSSEREDTYQKITEVMKHKAFDIKTPNKVFAVIRGYVNNTPLFHNINGSGYKWLADLVIELDKINPKTAARAVQVLNNFEQFETKRKKLMQEHLRRINEVKDLSDNTREITAKILNQTQN